MIKLTSEQNKASTLCTVWSKHESKFERRVSSESSSLCRLRTKRYHLITIISSFSVSTTTRTLDERGREIRPTHPSDFQRTRQEQHNKVTAFLLWARIVLFFNAAFLTLVASPQLSHTGRDGVFGGGVAGRCGAQQLKAIQFGISTHGISRDGECPSREAFDDHNSNVHYTTVSKHKAGYPKAPRVIIDCACG